MPVSPDEGLLTGRSVSDAARIPGFACIRDGSSWRIYAAPEEILAPTDSESLRGTLRRIEEHARGGGQAAGLIRYEAGYALEPRLRPLLSRDTGAFAWFGLYRTPAIAADLPSIPDTGSEIENLRLEITRDAYCARISAIRQLIEAGEVYQINFTTRVHFDVNCDAWQLFTGLVRRHPVPYAAFLNLGDEQIVSLSPELFFNIENGQITVRPMKGTAPRGRTLEEDIASGESLRVDPKNRAENVMIVDLMRNDLGRISRAGTVRATKLFDVERYPSLWQMTSTVGGELAAESGLESVVAALFPSGSVTGAPKIRAMEHIAHLEASPRGAYTGAIGFVAPDRTCFSVAIRTATINGRAGTMGVGGGITYGSSAEAEWEECRLKAAFLTQSTPEFKLIETMYWDGSYRHLEDHVDRMKRSAEYFDIGFDPGEFRKLLEELARALPAKPQRVRVTLGQDGKFAVEHKDYAEERFGRVRISDRTVSSGDRFLVHKTTNRRFYDEEIVRAREAGFDDSLFFNERGELTEGAIHNVFLVKGGTWLTPAVGCGALPGTCRAEILRKQPNARETVLTMDDLIQADAIYLCNSVRGVYPVELALESKSAPAAVTKA